MPVAAAIGAAGSLGSALIGSSASKGAADAQANAAHNAQLWVSKIYGDAQDYMNPYMEQGKGALNSLAQLYGLSTPGNPGGAPAVNAGWDAFTKLPAYTFPQQQGMLALTRNLNAQGLNMSGAQAKEAQQFGQGLASQYMMSNYVQPLMSFANQGQAAATSLGQIGASTMQPMSNNYQAQGQAQASGIMGSANAIAGGINGVANSLGAYSLMSQSPMGGGNFNPSSYSRTPGILPTNAMSATGAFY